MLNRFFFLSKNILLSPLLNLDLSQRVGLLLLQITDFDSPIKHEQDIRGRVSSTSPSRVPCALGGKGHKQEGMDRRPIFIPSTWSADGCCDASVCWMSDTRTVTPSVYVQVTSQQKVNLGRDALLFWDLLRTGEFILSV